MATYSTAQTVINDAAQDVQNLLGPEHPALLTYTNRVHMEILKVSRWVFLLSAPQRFLTIKGQTDYWIGPTASCPNYQVNTGLNLSNVEFIQPGTVLDRSNFRSLFRTTNPPDVTKFSYRDSMARLGRPKLWRYAPTNGNVLSIYPAPDNQNNYQMLPQAPVLTVAAGGTQAARYEQFQLTFVDTAGGESQPGPLSTIYVPANYVAVVGPPQPAFGYSDSGVSYTSYNVYGSLQNGTPGLQNASPINVSTAWTEPTTGLIGGVTPPSDPTIAPLGGYVIEFQYYQQRQEITSTSQILQIPDEYRSTITAGVNAMAYAMLRELESKPTEAAYWEQKYKDGIRAIIRDSQNFPRGPEFMRPDPSAITRTLPDIEHLDPTIDII
jgi:hypothetical protein